MFLDYDSAGIIGMTHWRMQLKGISPKCEIFDYTDLFRDDGKRIKDLRDFLHIDVDLWENGRDICSPLESFVSKLLKRRRFMSQIKPIEDHSLYYLVDEGDKSVEEVSGKSKHAAGKDICFHR